MRHLNPEALARLVDEPATPEERRHLLGCGRCATALAQLEAQTAALGSLPEIRPPAGDWAALEARLESEGLIETSGAGGPGRSREPVEPRRRGPDSIHRTRSAIWIRSAAAAALFLVGVASGALVTGGVAPEPSAEDSTVAEGPAGTGNPASPPTAAPRTVDEAVEALRDAEDRYVEALVGYRSLLDDGAGGAAAANPADRFAALEALMAAGQAAVREAPADPFLNGILASTRAEREATLRQISSDVGRGWY